MNQPNARLMCRYPNRLFTPKILLCNSDSRIVSPRAFQVLAVKILLISLSLSSTDSFSIHLITLYRKKIPIKEKPMVNSSTKGSNGWNTFCNMTIGFKLLHYLYGNISGRYATRAYQLAFTAEEAGL